MELSAAQPESKKLPFIDNLRVFLVLLVVSFHTLGAYTESKRVWYDHEPTKSPWLAGLYGWIIVMLFIFFMGLYFGISGYFVSSSYDKKGPSKFALNRLLRLGLPLAFYSLIMSPIMCYFVGLQEKHGNLTVNEYIHQLKPLYFCFGVTWFIGALLCFTLIYVLIRKVFNPRIPAWPTPGLGKVLLTGLIVGLITFLVRLEWPVDRIQIPTFFIFGIFPQYITMFTLGIIARHNNWLEKLKFSDGKKAGWIALILSIFGLPAIVVIGAIAKVPPPNYMGGFNWMSFAFSIWAEITGICISFFLLSYFSHRFNKPSALLSKLNRQSFTVYIFHPVFVITFSHCLHNWGLDPGLKALIVIPAVLVASFGFAKWFIKIPGINKIF